MAERTDDPVLDLLLERFARRNPWICDIDSGGPITRLQKLRDGKIAAGNCAMAAEALAVSLRKSGIDAEASFDGGDGSITPEQFGYHDRSIAGEDVHAVTYARKDGCEYMIDFTAAQYGYSEFPMVQKLGPDGSWQRDWEPPAAEMAAAEYDAAEVAFDG